MLHFLLRHNETLSYLRKPVFVPEVDSEACPLCLFLSKCSIPLHPKKQVKNRRQGHRRWRAPYLPAGTQGAGPWVITDCTDHWHLGKCRLPPPSPQYLLLSCYHHDTPALQALGPQATRAWDCLHEVRKEHQKDGCRWAAWSWTLSLSIPHRDGRFLTFSSSAASEPGEAAFLINFSLGHLEKQNNQTKIINQPTKQQQQNKASYSGTETFFGGACGVWRHDARLFPFIVTDARPR